MIPTEDFSDVTLANEDTDDHGDHDYHDYHDDNDDHADLKKNTFCIISVDGFLRVLDHKQVNIFW